MVSPRIMKRCITLSVLVTAWFSILASGAFGAGPERLIYGPVRYDVKERYGTPNIYADRFGASKGLFAIKLQNGEKPLERSEFIKFSLNGETVLRDGWYEYMFLACIVPLEQENEFELELKDVKPLGFKRPHLPARFVTMSVLPASIHLPPGVYGLDSWQGLKDIEVLLGKITNRETAVLAAGALDLSKEVAVRAETMRTLSLRKDPSALPLINAVFHDLHAAAAVRGEAATALGLLGNVTSIPALMIGIQDAEENVRLGSARALSLYPEENIREPLTRLLERLDPIRRDVLVSTMVQVGWKPSRTLHGLVKSPDQAVSATAINVLVKSGDREAFDLLLELLDRPGSLDPGTVIGILAETGDTRAVAALENMARNPSRRTGREAELAEALAALRDPGAVAVIADLAEATPRGVTRFRIEQAYKRLAGRDYPGSK